MLYPSSSHVFIDQLTSLKFRKGSCNTHVQPDSLSMSQSRHRPRSGTVQHLTWTFFNSRMPSVRKGESRHYFYEISGVVYMGLEPLQPFLFFFGCLDGSIWPITDVCTHTKGRNVIEFVQDFSLLIFQFKNRCFTVIILTSKNKWVSTIPFWGN